MALKFATNKFLQNLNRRLPADRADELNSFVAGVAAIIDRGEAIRLKNITDFLRYKNGLLSAVYMFTRYPNLKNVLISEKE